MSGGGGGDRERSASVVGNRFGRPSTSTTRARNINAQTNRKPGQVANYPDATALGTIGAIASKIPGPTMALSAAYDVATGKPSSGPLGMSMGDLGQQKGFVDRPGGRVDDQNRRRQTVLRRRAGLSSVTPKAPTLGAPPPGGASLG